PVPAKRAPDQPQEQPAQRAPSPPPRPSPSRPLRPKRSTSAGDLAKYFMWGVALLFVVAVITGIVLFIKSRIGPGRDDVPVVASVTADEIWTEYDKDYKAANQKYGNNFMVIKGKIRAIPKEKVPAINLETPGSWTIQCIFPVMGDIAGLQPGQEVTIRGECEPRSPKAPLRLYTCKIVPER